MIRAGHDWRGLIVGRFGYVRLHIKSNWRLLLVVVVSLSAEWNELSSCCGIACPV